MDFLRLPSILIRDGSSFSYQLIPAIPYCLASIAERISESCLDNWDLIRSGSAANFSTVFTSALPTTTASATAATAAAVAASDFDDFKAAVHLDFERRSVRSEQQKVWVEPETLETIRLEMADSGDRPGYAVTFLSASQVTGAARIDAADRTEWVLLLKIDGTWLPVNSFWAAGDSSNG